MYTKTLMAKRGYHLLVTTLLEERMETQHHRNAYTAMCLKRREWYKQAKHLTMQQYANAKESFLTHERYTPLCADTARLLTDQRRHAHYAFLQQGCLIQLVHDTAKAYRQRTALHWDASKQARQTIYHAKKRTRE